MSNNNNNNHDELCDDNKELCSDNNELCSNDDIISKVIEIVNNAREKEKKFLSQIHEIVNIKYTSKYKINKLLNYFFEQDFKYNEHILIHKILLSFSKHNDEMTTIRKRKNIYEDNVKIATRKIFDIIDILTIRSKNITDIVANFDLDQKSPEQIIITIKQALFKKHKDNDYVEKKLDEIVATAINIIRKIE